MNNEIKKSILQKICEYDRIIISCHIRPDGDAFGSALGLKEILKLTYPNKEIYFVNDSDSQFLQFLGKPDDEVGAQLYADALAIVVDTATLERVNNANIALAQEIIKIDHHIDIKPFGALCWVEEERSSVCEMITDFYYTFSNQLHINSRAATCLYAGMVTDSGRFKYSSVRGETLELAGKLLNEGVDLDRLYADIYLERFITFKFRAEVYRKMRISRNGVAYIHVTTAMQKKYHLTSEEASNVVNLLSSIKNCLAWLAFIDNGDGTLRVRLRSRYLPINKVAENYGGGGHAQASGATLHSKKQIKHLVRDADNAVVAFRQTHGEEFI